MAYKSWSRHLIKKQLLQVATAGSEIDKASLHQLLNNSVTPFNTDDYPISFASEKELYNEYSYYLDYIKQISLIPKEDVVYPSLIELPISSQLEFVHDFFASVAPEWMDIFNKIYNERKRNLRIGNYGSYSVYLESIDYSYISINKINLIDDLFDLVHEYTHAIVDRLCFRQDYNSNYPFVELPSMNMELISSIFMTETYSGIEEDIECYLKTFLNVIINHSKNIVSLAECLSEENESNCDKYNQIKKSLSSKNPHFLIQDITYTLPFIHIVEMFYLYKEDREKWFYILNKIINMKPSNNYLSETKKLGLTPNKDLDRFINDLKISK